MGLAGEVRLVIESPSLKYDLAFSRNISVIRGQSGTGKSRLCELIEQSLTGIDGLSLECLGCDQQRNGKR